MSLRVVICFACLLCVFPVDVASQNNRSTIASNTTTTTTTTTQSVHQTSTNAPTSKTTQTRFFQKICERYCIREALTGPKTDTRPLFCRTFCQDFEIPEEFLNPDALCTLCPDETCQSCRCDNGECLRNNTIPTGTTNEAEVPDGALAARGLIGGTPLTSQYCSSCYPRRQCRPFWFCRN